MVKLFNSHNAEVAVQHRTFPAGEVYVKILELDKLTHDMYIHIYAADAETIMRAVMLANACTEQRACTLILVTSYTPYSRQDRVVHVGESDSFKIFQQLMLGVFHYITCVDVHNPSACLSNCYSELPRPKQFISVKDGTRFSLPPSEFLVVSPDAGAQQRASRFAQLFACPVTTLDKQRTPEGITQTVLEPEAIKQAQKLIIVDDICDGGATFLKAAEELRKHNSDAGLYLVVSHGIFSAGLDALLKVFSDIFVLNNPYNVRRLTNV